jgi:hypothetical protein
MPLHKPPLAALVAAVLSLILALPLAAQQPPNVRVAADAAATTVWDWASASPSCGNGDDYSDVPARPFMVGRSVLWFASNPNGFASVGTGGADILATLRRGLPGMNGCVQWLTGLFPDTPLPYPTAIPNTYSMAYWLVAPYYDGSKMIYALVHNEFHGEWTNNTQFCPVYQQGIFLPCNYWNMVSAKLVSFGTFGNLFHLNQTAGGVNVPAIALGNPYIAPPANTTTGGPQGMAAQSNIMQDGPYLYVLAQQLQAPGANQALNGVCLYRAALPLPVEGTLTWLGWDGSSFSVAVPPSYPTSAQALCQPVLPAPFRFSISFNTTLGQYIVLGQDALANIDPSRSAGCPLAPNASNDVDMAFVYMTLPAGWLQNPTTQPVTPETCLLRVNPIQAANTAYRQAYPSLLDPASPQLGQGDVNFLFSGPSPFLYFTQIYPLGPGNPKGYQRDLLRLQLTVTAP